MESVVIEKVKFLSFGENTCFKFLCMYAALKSKLLNLNRFPPDSPQTYKLGHYRCIQSPAHNGQGG